MYVRNRNEIPNITIAETVTNKRKQSIRATDDRERMGGGVDDTTSVRISMTSDNVLENQSPATDKAESGSNISPPSTQNVQACSFNTLNSFRVLCNSKISKEYPSTPSLLRKEDSIKIGTLDNGQMCSCAKQATGEEKKVDEMIEYGIQNLNEAEKALSHLGDNFEHDLKLMFMDIMARVQHWVSVVQNRIYAARADLESLRKESIARFSDISAKDMELIELRRKLGEAEASLAMQAARNKQHVEIHSNSGQASQAGQECVSTSVQTAPDKEPAGKEGKPQSGSAVSLMNTACQSGEDKEKAELEAELAQLLEENERMIKERGDYENAIHCALLRGVSSLNVEALKVLRYPPIPFCGPCGLSPLCSSLLEPVVSSRSRTTRCDATPQPTQRGANALRKNDKIKGKKVGTDSNPCQPVSEQLYCNRGNERCSENGIFLLHDGDAGNLQPRYHPSGSLSNKGSVCVRGKCKKSATAATKEKVSCAAKSPGSHPAGYDMCVRSRDDPGENSTAKKNTLTAKRCGACNRNRRSRDE